MPGLMFIRGLSTMMATLNDATISSQTKDQASRRSFPVRFR